MFKLLFNKKTKQLNSAKRLTMMGCDECGNQFYVDENNIVSVKTCCHCGTNILPYPTYSYEATPTMEEKEKEMNYES